MLASQTKKKEGNDAGNGTVGHPFNFRDICRDLASVILQFLTAMVIYLCRLFDVDNHPLVKYVDPLTAIAGVVIVVVLSVPMIHMPGLVVLQGCPEELDASEIVRELRHRFRNVIANVHEVHFWSLVPNDHVVGTMHVTFKRQGDYLSSDSAVKDFLASKGVSCLTLQPEFEQSQLDGREDGVAGEGETLLNCDETSPFSCAFCCTETSCQTKKCCIPTVIGNNLA